jgi:DNA (cytosine-5)-methyltransferase 1
MKSVEELSDKLSVTPQLIRKRIRDGIIKADLVGKTWVLDEKQFDNPELLFSIIPTPNDQVNKEKPKRNKPICLSFFSGILGLDLGIEKNGFQTLLACEIDGNARKTILLNRPNIGLINNIENYSAKQIKQYAGIDNEEIDLITGGPPCQAFSTAGKREGFGDSRGNVFLTFIDRILELKPKYAIIENVRGLLSAPLQHRPHNKRGFGYPPLTPEEEKGGALLHIIKKLRAGGYSVSFNLYNSANFGTPQKRERVIILCKRGKEKLPYLNPTHSENNDFGLKNWTTFLDVYPNSDEPETLKFPEKRLKYYRMLKPGEYWKHLPEEVKPIAMGKSFFAGGGKTGFFRRLAWDKPSPTLVTNPTMPATDLAHPTEDRPLSVQEYKRIQQIPDEWIIFGKTVEKYKQIGNAVPFNLGVAAGKVISNDIKGLHEDQVLNFDYSRYKQTDDVSFLEKMSNKIVQPRLF